MRAFAQNTEAGSFLPEQNDPPWLVIAFRPEDAPLLLYPTTDADLRRVLAWVVAHPDQLELLQHALSTVFGADSWGDFLRLVEEEGGEDA